MTVAQTLLVMMTNISGTDRLAHTVFSLFFVLQDHDYRRFEKDRVLTVLGYQASKRLANGSSSAVSFDQSKNTTRGLESLTEKQWKNRQEGEKKDLYRAIKLEQVRQKDEGCFPDLDRFRVVSVRHTKGGRDRALQLAQDDAQALGKKPSGGRNRMSLASCNMKTPFVRMQPQKSFGADTKSTNNGKMRGRQSIG